MLPLIFIVSLHEEDIQKINHRSDSKILANYFSVASIQKNKYVRLVLVKPCQFNRREWFYERNNFMVQKVCGLKIS